MHAMATALQMVHKITSGHITFPLSKSISRFRPPLRLQGVD